jgi:hypothetical protein
MSRMAQRVAGVWVEMCRVYICWNVVFNTVRDKSAIWALLCKYLTVRGFAKRVGFRNVMPCNLLTDEFSVLSSQDLLR